MIAYFAAGPTGTRFASVRLRLVAYHPASWIDRPEALKVIVQVMDATGRPVAEDPITEGQMTPLEFAAYLSASRADGWEIAEDPSWREAQEPPPLSGAGPGTGPKGRRDSRVA